MPLKVVFADEAERDLEDAVTYLLERNPEAAAALVDDVIDLAHRLAEGLFDGPWETLSDGRRVQSWPLPPYRLFYRRSEYALIVLRVRDQRRRPR
ncbi:type II toxin-antitoxin system RelE/ParE family toxin [Haliangium sp.]|uniref:type II toxin-antitoxin system RelE/ParE family toxin n=1 Tax=Haliangium sp. TaxID=2663208 RepID=UPI003D0BC7B0